MTTTYSSWSSHRSPIAFLNISEYVTLGYSVFVPATPELEKHREQITHETRLCTAHPGAQLDQRGIPCGQSARARSTRAVPTAWKS